MERSTTFLWQRSHIRVGLPAQVPVAIKKAINKAIKKADRISAWLEATQIAGFAVAESDNFFGNPDAGIVGDMTLHLRPPKEVRDAFVARHENLLSELD